MIELSKPHFIDGKPASTQEIVPVVLPHATHDGIAFFASCQDCQDAKANGRYPHWFSA